MVKSLDLSDGTYKRLYEMPYDLTDPKFTNFNAVAIDPTDDKAYGVVSHELDSGRRDFLVRFGMSNIESCLLYTSPSPRDGLLSRMPSSA